MRIWGARHGFRLVTLDGQDAVLAHINIHGAHRVSKYRVDIEALERVGVSALRRAAPQCDLVVIDEIGKMELFSASFREVVLKLVDSGRKVLGTIMLNPHPWADAVKQKSRVNLVTVTKDNRPQVRAELQRWLRVINSSNYSNIKAERN